MKNPYFLLGIGVVIGILGYYFFNMNRLKQPAINSSTSSRQSGSSSAKPSVGRINCNVAGGEFSISLADWIWYGGCTGYHNAKY